MHIAVYEFNSGTGTQIGAADTDYYKNIACLSDFLSSRLNACVLFPVVVNGALVPAEKIGACAVSVFNSLKSLFNLGCNRLKSG